MSGREKGVDVVAGIDQSVLTDGEGTAPKAHGCQAIVLGYDDISRGRLVDQNEVDAIPAFVGYDGNGAGAFQPMRGVAKEDTRHPVFLCKADGAVHHRTAIAIN